MAAIENPGLQPDPLVSVIVPFFNAERFLEEAVESVLAQSYRNWELILVDDGSSDGSTQIASRYTGRFPERISYFEHESHCNRGISASRNAGLGKARGQYVAFLDADDMWLPDKLSRQIQLIQAQPGASMVYGLTQYWYSWTGNADDRKRDFIPDPGLPAGALYTPPKLLLTLYPLGNATAPSMSDLLIARDLLDRTGGFEEQFRGMYEDQAFLVKAYLHGSVFVADECWDRYRIHPDSCLSTANSRGQYRAARAFFMSWLESYLDGEGVTGEAIRSALQRAQEMQPPKEDVHYNGWFLRVAGANEADLAIPPQRPEAMRIAVWKCDTQDRWDIQLNLPRLKLHQDGKYRVRFEARADRPRSIAVGAAMAHEPWSGLGLYHLVELTAQWERFDVEFVAGGDDENARIHFDLGGSDVAVEFAAVGLFLEDGSPAPSGLHFGALRRITPISRMWGYDRGVPIDRYYIEKFLANRAVDVRGRVLEIEDNRYTIQFGGDRVSRSDVLHVLQGNPKATIVGDLTDAPHIPDGSFDCIVLTQTLQLIYDVRAAVRTLYRILKPGGVLLATFPGITQNNDLDWGNDWYWSFTPLSARRMFGDVFPLRDVAVETFGNVLSAMSFLHGISAGELSRQELDYADRGYEVTIGVRAVKESAQRETAVACSRDRRHRSDDRALVLMYHRVAEADTDPYSLCVSPRHFAEHLEVIRRQAQAVSLHQLADCLRDDCLPGNSLAVTFDDGYVDNLHCARPLLEKYDVPATVFVVSGCLEQQREFWWDELQRIFLEPGVLPPHLALSVQEISCEWELGDSADYTAEQFQQYRHWKAAEPPPTGRHSLYLTLWKLLQPIPDSERCGVLDELSAWSGGRGRRNSYRCLRPEELAPLAAGGLVEIGAHSVTHPALRELPAQRQQMEIAQSKRDIEQVTGTPVTSFAYPFGSLSGQTVALVGAAGFDRACSTNPSAVRRSSDRYCMPRLQVEDWDGEEFARRLAAWFDGATTVGKGFCQ